MSDIAEIVVQMVGTERDNVRNLVNEIIGDVKSQMVRPSVLYRPRIYLDRNTDWIVYYGDNLQLGVVGCGKSPAEAMDDFDRAWFKMVEPRKPPTGK